MPPADADPLPLRAAQLRALVAVTTREVVWGRRAVSREIRRWRYEAERIPGAELRADALDVLTRKRGNTDGAALFWTLAPRRDRSLLRLLVAHEIIWDFLDNVSEHGAFAGERNGRQLHRALAESLDPSRPISDHYLHHPWRDDGGFLRLLVETCRTCLARLPSYDLVRSLVVREAERGAVQSLNHELNPTRRDRELRRWAANEHPGARDVRWFELSAAACAPLAIYVLLALAAEPRCEPGRVADAYAAYFPWVSLATVMLDSYADRAQDAAEGAHCYLAHYADEATAIDRLRESLGRAARGVLALPRGERHAVVVACMAALYLSKDSTRAPRMRATTRELAIAGGSLTRLLLPILRLWRVLHGQQAA